MARADLHNHLRTFSTMKNFNKVVDVASQKLGRGGILGVVNFEDTRFEDFTKLSGYERENKENFCYVPEKDLVIVKGQEVPTKQGHLLVYGMHRNKHIKAQRSLEDTIKEARDYNTVIILDHMFGHSGTGSYIEKNKSLLEKIDGIEIHNGEIALPFRGNPKDANRKAEEFYLQAFNDYPHLSAIASSDGHSIYEIGSSYTEIAELNIQNSEAMVNSLRKNLLEAKAYHMHNSYLGAIQHAGILKTVILFGKLNINIDSYHWKKNN